jgi:glycerophosphoryl diester phosphodiesterase
MTANPWLNRSRPLSIAHRGHSIAVPENTREAYRRAIELGIEMIECDVNMTRDGELVMIHDWSVDRTTDGTGRVGDLSLEEIGRLDAGSWFGAEFSGLRIPTTVETIELAREARVLMCFEVKGETAADFLRTAEALADLLAARDTLDWAFMSSYDHEALAAARARVPELLLAPERLPDDVPPPPGEGVRQAQALGSQVLQNHWRFVTPELVQSLHDHDIALWTWPTTEESEIATSLAQGVDGVMGDDAAALVRAVAELEPATR